MLNIIQNHPYTSYIQIGTTLEHFFLLNFIKSHVIFFKVRLVVRKMTLESYFLDSSVLQGQGKCGQ